MAGRFRGGMWSLAVFLVFLIGEIRAQGDIGGIGDLTDLGLGSTPMDLVFVVDTSQFSNTSDSLDKEIMVKTFLTSFLESTDIDSGKVKIALVTFSTHPEVVFDLNKYSKSEDMVDAIFTADFIPGERNTADALGRVRSQLFARDRPDAPNVVLLLTSGKSNRNEYRTLQEAEALKYARVNMFVVGYGLDKEAEEEINEIASKPTLENTFLMDYVDELEVAKELVFLQIFTRAEQAYNSPAAAQTASPTVSPLTQRSDLKCQPDSIAIFLPDTIFPIQRTITWKEDFCSVIHNGSHYVSDILLTECGTTVLIENDTVTFSNELIVHKEAGDNDAAKKIKRGITYGEDYETVIPVKCIYPRFTNVSTNYSPVKQNVRFVEKRFGTLDVSMEQFEDEQFDKSFGVNSFPRKVPLDDDVFIRVGLNFEPNSVRVVTDKCIATSTPSCADSNWEPLIVSGCPKDNVRLLSTNASSDVRFSFKAFDFRHNSSGFIYIHCEVSVCGADDIACSMGCTSRGKRSVSSRQGSHLVSAGPLLVERKGDNKREVVAMPTVFVVVCAVVAMASVVVAAVGWTRKPRNNNAAI